MDVLEQGLSGKVDVIAQGNHWAEMAVLFSAWGVPFLAVVEVLHVTFPVGIVSIGILASQEAGIGGGRGKSKEEERGDRKDYWD